MDFPLDAYLKTTNREQNPFDTVEIFLSLLLVSSFNTLQCSCKWLWSVLVSWAAARQPCASESLEELWAGRILAPPQPCKAPVSLSEPPCWLGSLEPLIDHSLSFPFFSFYDFQFMQYHQSGKLSFGMLTSCFVFTVAWGHCKCGGANSVETL